MIKYTIDNILVGAATILDQSIPTAEYVSEDMNILNIQNILIF